MDGIEKMAHIAYKTGMYQGQLYRHQFPNVNADKLSGRDIENMLRAQNDNVMFLIGLVRDLQDELGKMENRVQGVEEFKELCRLEYERHQSEQDQRDAKLFLSLVE